MSSADFDRAAAELRQMDRVIQGALPTCARAGGQVLLPEVKQRAPRDDGDLQQSIRGRPGDRDNTSATYFVIVGVFYAPFVEYGHGGPHPAPPHPFLRPAADGKADEIAEAMEGVIQNQVRFVMT